MPKTHYFSLVLFLIITLFFAMIANQLIVPAKASQHYLIGKVILAGNVTLTQTK